MQKISINNFQQFQQVDVEIKNILLLIGEQASGKSTISKLIYFFKSLRTDIFHLISENIDTDINLARVFIEHIQDKFYNFFASVAHLSKFEISYFYAQNKCIKLSHVRKGQFFIKPIIDENFYTDILNEARILMREIKNIPKPTNAYEEMEFDLSKNQFLDRLDIIMSNLFEDDRDLLFIPAGRNITVTYPDKFKLNFYGELTSQINKEHLPKFKRNKNQSVDIYLMIEFLKKVEMIKDRFKGKDFHHLIEEKKERKQEIHETLLMLAQKNITAILKGVYQYDEQGEKIIYNLEEKKYVHLNNASSGQQECIRILQDIFLVLLDHDNVFRVIEEPEAHLYPMAQRYLIELIALMLNNHNDTQVVITTHSPYILNIFNNLLYATRVATMKKDIMQKDIMQKVNQVVPKMMWINPLKFEAYSLKDGGCKSVFDKGTGLIAENYLDDISEELGSDFDMLYHIRSESFK